MQLLTGRTDLLNEAALDCEMDILVGDIKRHFAAIYLFFDFAQPSRNGCGLAGGNQSHICEHRGVRDRAADVMAIKTPVKGQGSSEGFDFGQPRALETTT